MSTTPASSTTTTEATPDDKRQQQMAMARLAAEERRERCLAEAQERAFRWRTTWQTIIMSESLLISNSRDRNEDLMDWLAGLLETSCNSDWGNGTYGKFIAFDMEGKNLGRTGQTSLVQLSMCHHLNQLPDDDDRFSWCEPPFCFLFDMLRIRPRAKKFLKSVLESKTILKIVHDCRVDSEALLYCHNIRLCNVHDTQAWHQVLVQDSKRLSLNATLEYYGVPLNTARDTTVYKTNDSFWLKRPLTDQMAEWACTDVARLFDIYWKQKENVDSHMFGRCSAASNQNITCYRDAAHFRTVPIQSIARVIGTKGMTISRLRSETAADLEIRGNDPKVLIYAASEKVLCAAKVALKPFRSYCDHFEDICYCDYDSE